MLYNNKIKSIQMTLHPATIQVCVFLILLFIILNEVNKTPPPM